MGDREYWANMPYAQRIEAIRAFTWFHYVNPDLINWELV